MRVVGREWVMCKMMSHLWCRAARTISGHRTYIYIYRERERDRQTERESGDATRVRQTDRQRERERERERDQSKGRRDERSAEAATLEQTEQTPKAVAHPIPRFVHLFTQIHIRYTSIHIRILLILIR